MWKYLLILSTVTVAMQCKPMEMYARSYALPMFSYSPMITRISHNGEASVIYKVNNPLSIGLPLPLSNYNTWNTFAGSLLGLFPGPISSVVSPPVSTIQQEESVTVAPAFAYPSSVYSISTSYPSVTETVRVSQASSASKLSSTQESTQESSSVLISKPSSSFAFLSTTPKSEVVGPSGYIATYDKK